MSNNIVILNNSDNVCVAITALKKGELIKLNNTNIQVLTDIDFGHKIALVDINTGQKILKYGVPIGMASLNIKAGAHVHTHNMESLYIKQFTK